MDVLLSFNQNIGKWDWSWQNGDVVTGYGIQDLRTAVIVSLFSDAQCDPSYVPTDDPTNQRGWWGNTYRAYPYGSLLWELARSKGAGTTQVLLQARGFCDNALKWLVDKGIAASAKTTASWAANNALLLNPIITKPIPNIRTPFNYSWAWAIPPNTPAGEFQFGYLDLTFILNTSTLA